MEGKEEKRSRNKGDRAKASKKTDFGENEVGKDMRGREDKRRKRERGEEVLFFGMLALKVQQGIL